jgi:hypothetical protein
MSIIKEKEEVLICNQDFKRKIARMSETVENHDRIIDDVNEL